MPIGIVPGNGFQLVDGDWLNGLAAGHNATYASGIAAAGTTQATATQIPDRVALIQVDTVGASSGVNLPAALQGTQLRVYNSTATTLAVYPQVANNPITGAQDTINSGSSLSGGIATHVAVDFACAKNGVWSAR